MNDNVFLDTNLLVYSYSIGEPEKQRITQQLIINNISFISTQVLQELTNTLTRKFKISYNDTIQVILECSNNNLVHTNSESTIIQACRIADQYGFSFYDSLIISAALECQCSVLYSEDLNNGQIIDKVLTIRNPYLP
jgi:predicted nucleic acid-binding protein